jgi:O-antigen/teichoic acid export membrane protein
MAASASLWHYAVSLRGRLRPPTLLFSASENALSPAVSFERNIVANFASQGYLAALNLALLPFYVAYMGAEAYGLIGFFATLQAWFMLLDFGLSQTLVREAARYRGGVLDPDRFRGLVLAIEI